MKRQLSFIRFRTYALSLLLVLVMIPTTFSYAQTYDNDKSIVSIDVYENAKSKELLSYQVDFEGNISGPEDFSIDGDDVYLLNSANNSILKFTNGYFSNQIDMDEIKAVKIAGEDGTLYVLGNDYSIIQISPDDNRVIIPVGDINTEAITDFKVNNGVLYIVTSEGDAGTTYILNTKGEIKERNIKKLSGRIFDEDTVYQVKLIPEKGHSIGHSCEMKIIDIKSGDNESIILKSEYWVAGAQFLGYDNDGNYRIKMFEMATDEDFNIVVEETIRTIEKDGSTKAIRGLDTQFKSIPNQVKVFGNGIYELNNLQDKVQIINISEPNEKTTSSYKSKLENIMEPVSDLDAESRDNQLMISRTTIMSNAKSFHSSFSWSCQSKNLAALTNWTKPRYVSRCWGTSTKYGTSTIMNVAKKINASDLLQGDALNYSGSHIVLFDKLDGAGNYVLYEATTLNSYDRVSHTTRSISSMGNYVPIRYNGVS